MNDKEECIPVGCIPSDTVAGGGGVSAHGGLLRGCLPREGVCLGEGCLPRGGVCKSKIPVETGIPAVDVNPVFYPKNKKKVGNL